MDQVGAVAVGSAFPALLVFIGVLMVRSVFLPRDLREAPPPELPEARVTSGARSPFGALHRTRRWLGPAAWLIAGLALIITGAGAIAVLISMSGSGW